jgi:hypothetical protein
MEIWNFRDAWTFISALNGRAQYRPQKVASILLSYFARLLIDQRQTIRIAQSRLICATGSSRAKLNAGFVPASMQIAASAYI